MLHFNSEWDICPYCILWCRVIWTLYSWVLSMTRVWYGLSQQVKVPLWFSQTLPLLKNLINFLPLVTSQLKNFMNFHESWWKKPSNFHENSWKFTKFHEHSWIFMKIHDVKLTQASCWTVHEVSWTFFGEIWWNLRYFSWILMNFDEYWVIFVELSPHTVRAI